MEFLQVFLITLFATFDVNANRRSNIGRKIAGGQNAKDGAFPYQVSLRQSNEHFCGGSILNNRWILTAAHCTYERSLSGVTVVAGTTSLKHGGSVYNVERFITHEHYSSAKSYLNDIALVRVNNNIAFNNRVQPIELYKKNIPDGTELTLTGWGTSSFGGALSNELKTVKLKQIGITDCAARNKNLTIYASSLCTMSNTGHFCQGDSGGPLVYHNQQIGVVSWNRSCAQGYPDVYIRVLSYLNWIKSNMY